MKSEKKKLSIFKDTGIVTVQEKLVSAIHPQWTNLIEGEICTAKEFKNWTPPMIPIDETNVPDIVVQATANGVYSFHLSAESTLVTVAKAKAYRWTSKTYMAHQRQDL